jgi:hypothetical protein
VSFYFNNKQEAIYKESLRIADQLCDRAILDNQYVYWETLELKQNKKYEWVIDENLYDGVSGIALYLLELYGVNKNKKYLNYVLKTAKWLKDFCIKNKSNFFAFLTGRLGVSYLFLRLYDILEKEEFLETAIEIAQSANETKNVNLQIRDYINGSAGSLVFLLYLYSYRADKWILESIEELTQELVDSAHIAENGLYWDRSSKHMFGLCGFSHGVSGISLAFFELSKVTGNDAFQWFAEYALEYEHNAYNSSENSWPDFRQDLFYEYNLEEIKKIYIEKGNDFFCKPNYMNAWCHGGIGIALNRIQAYQMTKNYRYLEDIKHVLLKIREENETIYKDDFVSGLCHGYTGNFDLFIELSEKLDDNELITESENAALKAISYYKKNGRYKTNYKDPDQDNTSLFTGIAGIGYFYLRVLFRNKIPNILTSPIRNGTKIDLLKHSVLSSSIEDLMKKILQKRFFHTINELEKVKQIDFNKYSRFNKKSEFISFIREEIDKKNEVLLDAFHFELKIDELESVQISDTWLTVDDKIIEETNKYLDINMLINLKLNLSKRVVIFETKNNWISKKLNSKTYNLIYANSYGHRKYDISYFAFLLLDSYQEASLVKDKLVEILDCFEYNTDSEKDQIIDKILLNINEYIKIGFLRIL